MKSPLKEELEFLRGESIDLILSADKIPCVETSDSEMLCTHPVVSVYMLTYNHEPYIRQAIEGVMMQETDFEFELVIGEDASTDKTREICFEYQKKYPDKIRVLWSEKNLYKISGNSIRTMSRCRGEFFAWCEGDDYWTDPLKLQKQVDVMRKYPNVGLCFCGAKIFTEQTGGTKEWEGKQVFPAGVISGNDFFNWHCFGKNPKEKMGPECFIMTATTLLRTSLYQNIKKKYEILNWSLVLSDTPLWLGLSSVSDVYFIPDIVSVYRRNGGSVCARAGRKVGRDAALVRYYFSKKNNILLIGTSFRAFWERFLLSFIEVLSQEEAKEQKNIYAFLLCRPEWHSLIHSFRYFLFFSFFKWGLISPKNKSFFQRYVWYSRNTFMRLKERFHKKVQ